MCVMVWARMVWRVFVLGSGRRCGGVGGGGRGWSGLREGVRGEERGR
jgi:hypothetical protein